MQRVLVVGITGAGKSSAARRLATTLGVPFHELDALALGPGWTTPPDFVDTVQAILERPGWVLDSFGYEPVREAMWAAADTVVWLDYPRRVVAARVLRRSAGRTVRRTPVFGGNIETWRSWLDPEHPVWWAMTQFRARRRLLLSLTTDPQARHLQVYRLRTPGEFESFLARLQPVR